MVLTAADRDGSAEAEDPRRDDRGPLQPLGYGRAALDDRGQFGPLGVWNRARPPALGHAQVNDPRVAFDVVPLERQGFHFARATEKREVARIAKVGAQLRAQLRPLARIDKALPHVQFADAREIGYARDETSGARKLVRALRHAQLEMHSVG